LYKQILKPKSFIQTLKILSIELIEPTTNYNAFEFLKTRLVRMFKQQFSVFFWK